jgi:hypothetical protein
MKMRIAILSTDTLHHRYFIRELYDALPQGVEICLVLFETKPYPWAKNAKKYISKHFPNLWKGIVLNPYIQPSYCNKRQNAFELSRFFPDGNMDLPDLPIHNVYDVNAGDAEKLLRDARADIAFVYGTQKIDEKIFSIPTRGCINTHGGKLPEYRGLDTNLWAAYEGKPEHIYATLHQMDKTLDTGRVYFSERVPIKPDMSIYSLRYYTCVLSVSLFKTLVHKLVTNELTPMATEHTTSRYFGPIPFFKKLRADALLKSLATK